jgi:hypothetical protein
MLFQLALIADRRDREQTTFARVAQGMDHATELMPANEAAIVVPAGEPSAAAAPASGTPRGEGVDIASLWPQMSLEIRAAIDASVQKEIAALRGFLARSLESQSERLQGDLAAVLPAPASAPDFEVPTLVPERRSWWAIWGWVVALLASSGAAFMSWSWWQQGGEIAALRTDLDAAYAEVETLRARPEVVSPVVVAPAAAADATSALPDAVPADLALSPGSAAPPAVDGTAPLPATVSPAVAAPDVPEASAPTPTGTQ